MFILKKGHQPGVYMPLRALFLVYFVWVKNLPYSTLSPDIYNNNKCVSSDI